MREVLERRFREMGARVWVGRPDEDVPPRIGIRWDAYGAYFTVWAFEPQVVAVDARDRHLLLLVRHAGEKSKFLCGHDERHWFVAAVPEDARGVNGVGAAKLALQPQEVRAAAQGLRRKERFRRRNAAFVRQGEWFFVPEPELEVPAVELRRSEPLSRGGGSTPHVLQFAYRCGGTTVYVNREYPAGLEHEEWLRLPRAKRHAGNWSVFRRDADVYATGTVRHPDHATVVLRGWHRVLMNTERGARAMRHVAFLD